MILGNCVWLKSYVAGHKPVEGVLSSMRLGVQGIQSFFRALIFHSDDAYDHFAH